MIILYCTVAFWNENIIISLKLVLVSFGRSFQHLDEWYRHVLLPWQIFQGGIMRLLWVWLRVHFDWRLLLKINFDDKYGGAQPFKHLKVIISNCSFHLILSLLRPREIKITEVLISTESKILPNLLYSKNLRQLEYWILQFYQTQQ